LISASWFTTALSSAYLIFVYRRWAIQYRAVKQNLPTLVDADLLSAIVANFGPSVTHDRPFHCHPVVSDKNDGDGLLELTNRVRSQRNY